MNPQKSGFLTGWCLNQMVLTAQDVLHPADAFLQIVQALQNIAFLFQIRVGGHIFEITGTVPMAIGMDQHPAWAPNQHGLAAVVVDEEKAVVKKGIMNPESRQVNLGRGAVQP